MGEYIVDDVMLISFNLYMHCWISMDDKIELTCDKGGITQASTQDSKDSCSGLIPPVPSRCGTSRQPWIPGLRQSHSAQ